MIDHRRHCAPKSEIQTHLDGNQNDGEHDPDHRRDEAKSIMKQIAECEGEDQWHVSGTQFCPRSNQPSCAAHSP